jgi:serine/threonine-protein kinase RsbW
VTDDRLAAAARAGTRAGHDPAPAADRAGGARLAGSARSGAPATGSSALATAGSARPDSAAQPQDQVTVRLPAEGAYLSVLRTATAGLAARLDFTLDEIEDLRIAVDEACAMLLGQAIPGSSLECSFTLGLEMTISVSVPCLTPRVPASDTFAWTVLTALAGNVEAHAGPGDRLTIVMRKSRHSSGSV